MFFIDSCIFVFKIPQNHTCDVWFFRFFVWAWPPTTTPPHVGGSLKSIQKMDCDLCKKTFCFQCRLTWDKNHEKDKCIGKDDFLDNNQTQQSNPRPNPRPTIRGVIRTIF